MAESGAKLPHARNNGMWAIMRRMFVPHHEPSLVPLFVVVGLGACVAGGYLLRLAVRSPDVCWDKKNNPQPWDNYQNKQYKFYAPTIDYSKLPEPPKY